MTCLCLSQKAVAKYLEKAEMTALSKTNPGVELAENERILLSRLKLDYDIW